MRAALKISSFLLPVRTLLVVAPIAPRDDPETLLHIFYPTRPRDAVLFKRLAASRTVESMEEVREPEEDSRHEEVFGFEALIGGARSKTGSGLGTQKVCAVVVVTAEPGVLIESLR